MDHASFDRLARVFGAPNSRRTALGALLGAGLAGSLDAAAKKGKRKKKKKKKRCKRLGDGCAPGGKRRCCNGLLCLPPPSGPDHRCCKGVGAACAGDGECCSENCTTTLGCQLPE